MWLGTLAGVVLCIAIGAVIIGGFYGLVDETFGNAEDIWEGVFSLVAAVVITVMGAVLLRVGKLQDSWRAKLSRAVEADRDGATAPLGSGSGGTFLGRFADVGNKYALFILPLITILREGFEGIIFIAGVILGSPVSSIPLSVLAGVAVGVLISYLIYR